ncbi:hypothetical protein EK904_003911 [Melospiza melodia maxima]|nr:hypothetical protein EK904_003911 [Melospiza melodia maxima]
MGKTEEEKKKKTFVFMWSLKTHDFDVTEIVSNHQTEPVPNKPDGAFNQQAAFIIDICGLFVIHAPFNSIR